MKWEEDKPRQKANPAAHYIQKQMEQHLPQVASLPQLPRLCRKSRKSTETAAKAGGQQEAQAVVQIAAPVCGQYPAQYQTGPQIGQQGGCGEAQGPALCQEAQRIAGHGTETTAEKNQQERKKVESADGRKKV